MIDQEMIHKQCFSEDPKECVKALEQLIGNFSQLPDKQQGWNDLIKLTVDRDFNLFINTVCAISDLNYPIHYLNYIFSQVPDKEQGWNELIKLIINKDTQVKSRVISSVGFIFHNVPDKQKAWNLLVKLIDDKNSIVRSKAIQNLRLVFSEVPDKQKAWDDLFKLTTYKYNSIECEAARALHSAYFYVPDKQRAWNDLLKLVTHKYICVRSEAAEALFYAFFDMPDKQQAWNNLIKSLTCKNIYVRSNAYLRLYVAYFYTPDKQQAWDDLIRLTNDRDVTVRTYANYSLGQISILKACRTKNELDYEEELEKAIGFFGKAAQESSHKCFNPARFCLPFYRSFHAIIFRRQEDIEEIDKYLEEEKGIIEGSKSKKLLFEVVENLANALKGVQDRESLDLEMVKADLNFYREYFDRVEELIRETEKASPYATLIIRKGLPILDRNLKELLEEIQKKAKITCRESQGTATQEIARAVNQEVKNWEISSQEEMTSNVSKVIMVLKSKIPPTVENKEIVDLIESMKYEKDLTRQYSILPIIIGLIPTVNVVSVKPIKEGLENLQRDINKIDAKLDEMIVSLKPGPRAELIISMGLKALGSGTQGVITIPLKEIDYPELPMDLEKIKGKFLKVSELPIKLLDKVRGYFL